MGCLAEMFDGAGRRGRCRVGTAIVGAGVVLSGLAGVGVPAAGATPVTLYAGASASGSANCQSAANACTLTTALAATAPGDVVELVTAGVEGTASTYYSGGFSLATPGTSAAFPAVIEPAPGVVNPILDGAGANTVLTVANSMHLVIDGVTIQNGRSNSQSGGGIVNNSGGTVTVNGSAFTGNNAVAGGAIANGLGGSGTLTVTGSTFTGNGAAFGAAIANGLGGSAMVTVTGSTFTNNTAGVDAGAIDNGGNSGSGTMTVTGSTFTGNNAADGGAIDNGDTLGSGTVTVTGSTFTGNTGSVNGGAIDNGDNSDSATVTVTESTFTGNTAGVDGGTIDSGDNGGTGNVVAAADIFAGSCAQSAGVWTDAGYNVGSDTTCQHGGTGDAHVATLAGRLGPLANNGGPTQTMLLLAGNPASGRIPNGSGVLCPLAADQTGAASPPSAWCNAGALQPHPAIKSVRLSGTATTTVVTFKGSGFGAKANLGPADLSCGGPATGTDHTNSNLFVSDLTNPWNAGQTCDAVGLVVTSYTNTKIVFSFQIGIVGTLQAGDQVKVTVLGATKTVTAPF